MRSRSELRSTLDDHTRVTFLEDDIDYVSKEWEKRFAVLETRFSSQDKKLDAIRSLQMAILVSLATGAVLFAMNFVALVSVK